MTDNIENLLRKADKTAGPPAQPSVNISIIRSRANRGRVMNAAAPLAAAAVLMVALGVWAVMIKTTETRHEQERVVALEAQIKQLQARTDATLELIHEVLEYERRQRKLDELQAELASVPDSLDEVNRQVDRAAFILVYQADRLYRELKQTESAVDAYNRVIRLFPDNQWAKVARQRLEEIKDKRI